MSEEERCSHVKVVIRVRPSNDRETKKKLRKVVHVMDSKTIIFDPKETEDKKKASKGKATKESEGKENKNLTFLFDHVFGEDSTQMEVFENTTQEVVDGVLNGFNCSGEALSELQICSFSRESTFAKSAAHPYDKVQYH
ncbi:kinesin-like protein KIF18A [Clarias magur]|uniref:Kinesin-like protein KIF18A n=1 Tax=Clarias magur TaxID=1594786 RepID=A0A8J4UT26_CLAMG|nr:kinesin-like protein KIF18A [Clarias magur]